MQSIRRRAFTVPTYLHKEKYKTQRMQTQKFLSRFLQKACGSGRSPQEKSEAKKEIKKSRGTKCGHKRKQAVKVNQNAKHFRTRSVRGWALTADLFTLRQIQKTRKTTKALPYALNIGSAFVVDKIIS